MSKKGVFDDLISAKESNGKSGFDEMINATETNRKSAVESVGGKVEKKTKPDAGVVKFSKQSAEYLKWKASQTPRKNPQTPLKNIQKSINQEPKIETPIKNNKSENVECSNQKKSQNDFIAPTPIKLNQQSAEYLAWKKSQTPRKNLQTPQKNVPIINTPIKSKKPEISTESVDSSNQNDFITPTPIKINLKKPQNKSTPLKTLGYRSVFPTGFSALPCSGGPDKIQKSISHEPKIVTPIKSKAPEIPTENCFTFLPGLNQKKMQNESVPSTPIKINLLPKSFNETTDIAQNPEDTSTENDLENQTKNFHEQEKPNVEKNANSKRCSMCGKGFSKIKNLKKHVSKVHKVSSERYEDLVEIMTENDTSNERPESQLPGTWQNQKKMQNDSIQPNPIRINLRPKSPYYNLETVPELSKEKSEDLVQNDSIPLQPIKVNILPKNKNPVQIETETFPEISTEKLIEIIETSKETSKDLQPEKLNLLPKTIDQAPVKIETLEISKESSEYLDRKKWRKSAAPAKPIKINLLATPKKPTEKVQTDTNLSKGQFISE